MNYKRVWAEVSLDSLAANIQKVRGLIPPATKLMAVVKADGYGHGAEETARVMAGNGADALGVAICEEGIQLRENGLTLPILVMGFTPEPLLDEIIRHGLTATVFSPETALALSKSAVRQQKRADIHIKIDTGMSRLGFLPREASVAALIEISRLPALNITGIYTHCATSDALENAFMYEQREKFLWVLKKLGEQGLNIPARHMMNSGAFAQTLRERRPLSEDFFFDMARIGVLLYGLPPSAEMAETVAPLGLSPVMSLKTQISMIKKIPAGVGVSYGHMFRTARETTVATLPVGYADGYPRRLSNQAHALINGKRAPVIGAICMDQCMADVTDIPEAVPGGEAVLLGSQGGERIAAGELAGIVGTIGYEIVCGVGKRVPRVYIKDGREIKIESGLFIPTKRGR
jgi:alanine racemase